MEIQTKPIELSYKNQMEAIRKACGNRLSANAFASLYLWQQQMQLSIHLTPDFFAIKCGVRGADTWFFPCGNRDRVEQFLRQGMTRSDFSLCYVGEEDARWLEERFPERWKLNAEEESDEYLCRMSDCIALSGGKYLGIRHKRNRILREHTVEARLIDDSTIEDALQVVSQWGKETHHVGNREMRDDGVSVKALSLRKELEIDGVIIYVEEVPTAVFAGFAIDEETVDALVGKCRKDAPRGFVYCAILEYFKKNVQQYTYCNLEEDLGIPGIRMVKEALRPESKNRIWTAVQR